MPYKYNPYSGTLDIVLGTPVSPTDGGTGITTYATGDILYASAADTLSKLPAGADGQVLKLAGGVPTWAADSGGQVDSVSGTTDRITITGTAADPIVNIAPTYVGQSSITTLGTITTGTWNGDTIGVSNGGTGATSLTDGGILLGSGTSAITATAQPTDGQLLIGSTGTDPVLASLTQPAAGMTITAGAGSITFALADDLAGLEAISGTGIVSRTSTNTYATSSVTEHSVLLGGASEAVAEVGPLTNGQLLIGSTGGAPVAATLTEGTGITITEGAGSITIDADNNGDVTAAESLTDNAIIRGDGGGKGVQDSGVAIDDSDAITGVTSLTVDNVVVDGNDISSSTGAITFSPSSYLLDHTQSANAGTVRYLMYNSDSTGSAQSDCHHSVQTHASSDGDPYYSAIITTTDAWSWGIDQSAGSQFRLKYEGSTSNPTMAAGTDTLVMTTAGECTKPLQPAFLAMLSGSQANVTGDGTNVTVALAEEIFDQGGDYNNATYTYTAPVTGIHEFKAQVYFTGSDASITAVVVNIRTSNRIFKYNFGNPNSIANSSGQFPINLNITCDMDAADTAYVDITVSGTTKTVGYARGGATDPRTWFAGSLLC